MSDDTASAEGYRLDDYLKEQAEIAEKYMEYYDDGDWQQSFWLGRATLISNIQEFIEIGVFDYE